MKKRKYYIVTMYNAESRGETFRVQYTNYSIAVKTASELHRLAKELLHWTNHNGFEVTGNLYRIYSQGFIRVQTIDPNKPEQENDMVVSLLTAFSKTGR